MADTAFSAFEEWYHRVIHRERERSGGHTGFIMVYVRDLDRSVALYRQLLGVEADHPSPVFAQLPLSSGVALEMWQLEAVQPAPEVAGGAVEIGFLATSREEVEQTRATWVGLGLTILAEPMDVPFGYTTLAVDPDGHRLRMLLPPQREPLCYVAT